MSKKHYYFDTYGNDDDAYEKAFQYAVSVIKQNPELNRITFLVPSKNSTGWLDRIYGESTVKKLFNGINYNGVIVKIETIKTYKNNYGNALEILICCGLNSEEIFKAQDYMQVDTIIAIPWLKENTQSWINTSNATKLNKDLKQEENSTEDNEYPEPSEITKTALQELTNVINKSTGITHHMDNNRAKTYIRALHKYEPELSSDILCSYLVNELGWQVRHANDVRKLIDTLNNGKYFQGGEKTGLQNHYKRWKNKK